MDNKAIFLTGCCGQLGRAIIKTFKNNGFVILKENFGKWPKLPVKKENLNDDFKKFSESELINRTSSLILIRE